jgi:hypothetical protein
MDLLAISSAGAAAFIVGALFGWLIARWRFATKLADLNSKLVLERRVNRQLSEAIQDAAMPSFVPAPDLTAPAEATREAMVVSG